MSFEYINKNIPSRGEILGNAGGIGVRIANKEIKTDVCWLFMYLRALEMCLCLNVFVVCVCVFDRTLCNFIRWQNSNNKNSQQYAFEQWAKKARIISYNLMVAMYEFISIIWIYR